MATFLVAEDEYWAPGLELCAALRHRGHTTIRLIRADEADRHQARWWRCASRTVGQAVTADGALTQVGREVVESTRPLDWQVIEPVQRWLVANGYEQQLGFRRTSPIWPDEVIDKWRMHEYLTGVGVPTPGTWADVSEVPSTQPGPFLLKIRDGGGGEGIVRLPELSQAGPLADQAHIIQRLYEGPVLDSAGVAVNGEIIQAITYRNSVNPRTPYSAAYGITVTNDPELMAYTARVVGALGLTGPFALDAVTGDDGQPLVIDVNPRIWGCWTACQALGMDVIGSYEFALGLGPRPQEFRSVPGRYAPIMRRPPLDIVSVGQRARWLAGETREAQRRGQWLGRQWRIATLRASVSWAALGEPVISRGS